MSSSQGINTSGATGKNIVDLQEDVQIGCHNVNVEQNENGQQLQQYNQINSHSLGGKLVITDVKSGTTEKGAVESETEGKSVLKNVLRGFAKAAAGMLLFCAGVGTGVAFAAGGIVLAAVIAGMAVAGVSIGVTVSAVRDVRNSLSGTEAEKKTVENLIYRGQCNEEEVRKNADYYFNSVSTGL